jgi:propionyl-CoA carboxylase alpha chain
VFTKILIANRGEIACRIMCTAERMGVATVAVYSEADADALHVRMADEAVAIGGPLPAESYLVIERIVAAARETGAQGVHPGFGFLAENAAFVEALEAAGIVFIGPGVEAIAAMGDKLESKRLAERSGVNTIPGHDGIVEDADAAARAAKAVGYPVMLKASAGGGGKGMRVARDEAEVREGFRAASSEARSSFGDDRLLVEKYIEEPRHIEIQVLADSHGNVIHLGERECSIQRRHQKVIEESPSPFLDAKTRAAMGAQAVALARAVDYRSAGTVEFMVDAKKNFYFLEMNTRLQVEHPVTEMVAGLDLVEQMLRVAAGETLAIAQKDVKAKGWAIEGRVYAEDPARGFLPSTGRLTRYRIPEGEGVRVDTGVYEGAEVSMYYDPMIAKLVAWGETREAAIARMCGALDAFGIEGPGNNLGFLASVMRHPRFVEGRITTGFIAEEYPGGFAGDVPAGAVRHALIGAAAWVDLEEDRRANLISGRVAGAEWRRDPVRILRLGGEVHHLTVAARADGVDVEHDGGCHELRGVDWTWGARRLDGTLDGEAITVGIARDGPGWRLSHGGARVSAVVRGARAHELAALMPEKAAPDRSRFLLSPMPGRVVSISVEPGQDVKAGESLAVVDAMKMENVLRAERDARVAKIVAAAGDSLSTDQVIIEFE